MQQFDSDALGYSPDHPAVVASLAAIEYGRKSWESMRDECLAWADVYANIDPGLASNTGHQYICWCEYGNGQRKAPPAYQITQWIDGSPKFVRTKAPLTLEDARSGPLLEQAIKHRDKFPSPHQRRPAGTSQHVLAILRSTPSGRAYIAGTREESVLIRVSQKASTGRVFGPDGFSRKSSITAHILLHDHPKCHEALAKGISKMDAEELRRRSEDGGRSKVRLITATRRPRRKHMVIGGLSIVESKGLQSMFDRGLSFEDVWHFWGELLVVANTADDESAVS